MPSIPQLPSPGDSNKRVTESGDQRVIDTTKGFADDRILDGEYNAWAGLAGFTATGTRIPFVGDPRIKHNGTWKELIPYVKYGGEWVVPTFIYVKKEGVWTRVY